MNHREDHLHREVAKLLQYALRPPAMHTCFPAGGGGALRGAILKGHGLKPGMPDHVVIAPQGNLWIELKVPKAGRVAAAQKACHEALEAAGERVEVCRSIDDVIEALDKHRIPHSVVA
jgi:hypothetical protein